MENQTSPSPESSSLQKSRPNFLIWIAAGVAILAIGIGVGLAVGKYSPKQISSYEDCIKAKGSSIQESYPGACVTVSGQSFVQPVSDSTPTPAVSVSIPPSSETPIEVPTPTPKNVQTLKYALPKGWETATDNSGRLEVGYDPTILLPTPGNLNIYFAHRAYPSSSISLTLRPYSGGSRHQFIYEELGYTTEMANKERFTDYYEKEYRYNGWSCLVLYGLGYSARGTTWGMCVTSSTQALFIEGSGEETTIKTISSIKLR